MRSGPSVACRLIERPKGFYSEKLKASRFMLVVKLNVAVSGALMVLHPPLKRPAVVQCLHDGAIFLALFMRETNINLAALTVRGE